MATISKHGVLYAADLVNPNPILGGTGVTEDDDTDRDHRGVHGKCERLNASIGYSFVAFATDSSGTSYTGPVSPSRTARCPRL